MDVLRSSWDDRAFTGLELQLTSLTEQINVVTEQHQAYPMVHYFHAAADQQAMATAVAVLDDALTLVAARGEFSGVVRSTCLRGR